MLEIVKFIHEHEDWETLLSNAPYNLKISWDDGFVLFKYNQINSDFNEPICLEARGLILDSLDNFKVVRMAFKKFFNLGEGYAARIDWDTAVASEKIDGSIMSVWFARGKWHLSTNGVIDAFKAEIAGVGPYKTFGDLFESVLPLSTFAGNRYENLCFTFELVSPYNKIVIDYPETKVYLLSVRFMHTLEEVDYDVLPRYGSMINIELPKYYYMNDETGFRKLVEDMPKGHEGIVVRDANGERVKIKTPLYFQLHRMKNNGVITVERIVNILRANEQSEFLAYFPELKEKFKLVERQLKIAEQRIEQVGCTVALWKFSNKDKNRKDFAQEFGKCQLASLYFAAYDNKLDKTVKNIAAKTFIKIFEIGDI